MTRIALLIILLAITVYSRFLNLDWDRGWGFHPDENNLWGASRQVELFRKLDPEFYAYGGVPIYLYSLLADKVEARAVSAGVQALIVILLFVLGKKLAGWNTGFFAAAMAAFSAGLVQAGHFLTVESLVGLFALLLFWCVLNYQELLKTLADRTSSSVNAANIWLFAAAVILGLGIGTKVSFAVFGLPFISILLRFNLWAPKVEPLAPLKTLKALAILGLLILISGSIFFLTNPFVFSKWKEMKSTWEYEARVATGSLPVFYTRQFIDTTGGWFQAVHVFPHLTGWLFLPMFIMGVAILCFDKVRPWRTPRSDLMILLAVAAALLSFLPFWAKWTRYVVQVLPILILVAGFGVGLVWEKGKAGKAIVIMVMISFLPQFFSTLNVYAKDDTRIAAAKWAEINIPKDAKIFTEAMDLGILPFNPTFGQNIKLFNFYELDEINSEEKQAELNSLLDESDYFILLSRRVYKNAFDHPDKFPQAAEFYSRLFNRSLGYKKIYESSQVVIPARFAEASARRAKAGIYLDRFLVKPGMTIGISPEETLEVFDNPTVVIFQKRI